MENFSQTVAIYIITRYNKTVMVKKGVKWCEIPMESHVFRTLWDKVVAAVLIGEYLHTIDDKGRVSFPSRLREDLGVSFIVTKGLDSCLFVYSLEEWQKLENKIRELPMSKARSVQRFLFASACKVECDKQGRIILPQSLREFAHLTKNVMVIGASVRAEIWDKDTWDSMCADLTGDTIEQAMEDLGF